MWAVDANEPSAKQRAFIVESFEEFCDKEKILRAVVQKNNQPQGNIRENNVVTI